MIALDTLALRAEASSGWLSEQQAEAQAEALAAVMVDSLATRTDLQELDLRMETSTRSSPTSSAA